MAIRPDASLLKKQKNKKKTTQNPKHYTLLRLINSNKTSL